MSTEANGLGSGRLGYGGAGVDQFNGVESVEHTFNDGRTMKVYPLPKREQTDPTPTIPESTQPKDPDEKSLSDLNKGNMPKIAERKLHLIVGTREEFNSSMQNNLDYLDGLIEGDGQNLKLDDSAANDLKAKIGELRQKIQDNPKMGRHKIYKKYNELKQEIVKSQNEKCCDKVLNDLKLDKSNLSNGVQQVYNKALSSKEPVDGEKFKKAAIKAHNKDVVDDIKKEIDDGKISSRNIAQKMKIKHFVSGALKQERLVSKDELKENLDSKFSGSTGVGAEGIAGDDENANAVDENVNNTTKSQNIDDDDNTNDLIDAIYNEPENDEFNANGNLLLNGAGASENNDVFIQNMNDGFSDDNEVNDGMRPYSLSELGEPKGVDIQDTEVTQSGQPSSSDAEVTNIDGNVDLNEAKDKEQILQECQQLIKESVEAFKNEYGGSEESAGWFGGKLKVLLRNMEGTNKFSVENFKKAVECEKAIYNEVLAAQEEFAKQDNLAENNTQYDSSKFATDLSVRLEMKLLNMVNSTNDLSVENFKKVVGEEKKNFVETFKLGYEVQIGVPTKADAKAKASRMKKLGRSIARGAAKFGTGCMNVLSAIGNAFVNAGKTISNAISRIKSNDAGYERNQLDNNFNAYSDASIPTDSDNDDPIWNGEENQDVIGDGSPVNDDPFMNEFEEAI